jgi:2-polyprenyl-3-methyl-5-hydroxy-6-metoxy-1,4-benzoquinol methylase
VTSRYYEAEHFSTYARMRLEGQQQWDDVHGPDTSGGYDHFPNRAFIEAVLASRPRRADGSQPIRVLEYGCGTGPVACFLAARGFRVDAVDLVPDAIAMARDFAAERGLQIRFDVQDICRWGTPSERFDFVIDSYCLQSIVTDTDRTALLAGVHARLKPAGLYLISTAMFDPERDYGDDRHDRSTGITWTPTTCPGRDAKRFDDGWYLPHRRHLTARELRTELGDHGFRVKAQSGRIGGDVICTLAT